MAYQPKSYKKFVATAATATLVATAIVPVASAADAKAFTDVSKNYTEAVNYLVTNGIADGKSDTKFGTTATITRGDAAVMIAKALKLDTAKAPSAGFKDVNARVAGSVNALVAAKIVSGKTATTFAPDANITRQEMAKIIANAYELDAGTTKNKFSDVNSNWDAYVDALVANEITLGKTETTFAPTASVTRGEFALFVFRTENLAPAVTAIKALDSTTITLTGKALNKFKAEDVTVANNTVLKYAASTDGKSATVTLATKLVVDVETDVTVNKVVYKVTYKITAVGAAVTAATYDDDHKDQYVAITLNGQKVTSQELIDAGYNVEFTGFAKKSGTKLNTLFTSGATASTTGELATNLDSTLSVELAAAGVLDTGASFLPTAGVEVYVQVKLSKGTETISSELSPIKIQNVDLATDDISAYTLENFGATPTVDDGTVNVDTGVSVVGSTDDFVQTSTTLVTGEQAALRNLTIVNDGKKETALYSDKLITVSSSNSSVISVKDGVLTAQTPGTATVTFAYGTKTKTVTFTVTNTKRALSKAVITKDNAAINATTLITSKGLQTFTGTVYDQFGDTFASDVTAKVTNNSTTTPVALLGAAGTGTEETAVVAADGKFTISITPKNPGTVVVTFQDGAGNKLTNSQLRVSVTNNANLYSYKAVQIDDKDTILDSLDADDNTGRVKLDGFTSENISLGKQVLSPAVVIKSTQANTATTGFTVKWAESVVGLVDTTAGVVVNAADDTVDFTVAEGKKGTVTITIIDNVTNKEASITYTVNASGANITGGTLKVVPNLTFNQVVDYKNVLNYQLTANDPIITGLTLTSKTAQTVRLNLGNTVTAVSPKGSLYIDKNANGIFDNKDVVVGNLDISLTGTVAAAAAADAVDGVTVATGDNGSIIYKLVDKNGNVVSSSTIKFNF